MLEHLFGSKTRVKLLRIFVSHPENAYYVRELTRLTRLQINAIRRELENLQKLELIVDQASDNTGTRRTAGRQEKRFYRINTAHVLYAELRALLLKAQLLLEHDLVKKIQSLGSIKLLMLGGLFVGSPGAPTDLLIVGSVPQEKLKKLIQRFERELNTEINFTTFTPAEYKYRKDMTDRFLYSILESKKIVVVDDLG